MEHSPPHLFRQGPSAFLRLLICVALACGLLVSDARFRLSETLHQAIGIVIYPLQQVALWPRDMVLNLTGFFTTTRSLQTENEILKTRNLKLALEALQAEQLQIENVHLRALLHLLPRAAAGAVVAEVRYEARDPFIQKVIVDHGERDGVQIGSPVIDDEGVLGQITRVYPLQSEVTLITDNDQSVPVQLIRTGLRGLISGNMHGEGLVLRFVPATADVQPGDELVTSGLDGVFPAGIPAGKITRVLRQTGVEFAQVFCMPTALTRGPRQVLILDYKKPLAPPPHTDINPSPSATPTSLSPIQKSSTKASAKVAHKVEKPDTVVSATGLKEAPPTFMLPASPNTTTQGVQP